MASATRDDRNEGVEFYYESDGTVTAKDLETGLARGGETRAEALAQLAEVLELHEDGGEPIDDPDEFLREELDIEPDDLKDVDHEDYPDFMR
ncbi:type II toxin-antitoxin system HicB family antitoxin [Natrialbaceae archaeon A-gly3]